MNSKRSTLGDVTKTGKINRLLVAALGALTALSVASVTLAADLATTGLLESFTSLAGWKLYLACLTLLLPLGAVALALSWFKRRRIDRYVIMDVRIDQMSRSVPKSVDWSIQPIRVLAPVFRLFAVENRLGDEIRSFDISSEVVSATEALETILGANPKSDYRLAISGRLAPAQVGLGALTTVPKSMNIVENLDNYDAKSGRPLEISGEAMNEMLRRTDEGADKANRKSVACRKRVGARDARLEPPCDFRTVAWKDGRAPVACAGTFVRLDHSHEEDQGVKRVRVALGAFKKELEEPWSPFDGVPKPAATVQVWAGNLLEKQGKWGFASAPLMASGEDRDRNKLVGLAAADYFASVLSWVLRTYPQAKVDVTARVPRSVAFALGYILSHDRRQAEESRAPVFSYPGFETRLRFWGTLKDTSPRARSSGALELAEMQVFPMLRPLPSPGADGAPGEAGPQRALSTSERH